VSEAHGAHLALVRAARSESSARAYDGLAGELRLFVTAVRPQWSLERMATQHEELMDELKTSGLSALRDHLAQGLESVLP
jgi:hypothetical protein